jgi:hypothetical protein
MSKQKLTKTDGIGPYEIKRIRAAVRLVWHRCHARALAVKRCTGTDGFTYCERCKERTPKLKIDHIENVGEVDSGFIFRMFVPSIGLQGLCKKCHDKKTALERNVAKICGHCMHPNGLHAEGAGACLWCDCLKFKSFPRKKRIKSIT